MTKIEQSFAEKEIVHKREIMDLLPEGFGAKERSGLEAVLDHDLHDENLLNMVAARLTACGYEELISVITDKIKELFGGRFEYLPVNEKYLEDQEEYS